MDSKQQLEELLVDLKDKIGKVHITYEFPSLEAAGVAYKKVLDTCKGISGWRYTNLDKTKSYVTAIGEETHQDQIDKAEECMKEVQGSVKLDEPPEQMLGALRLRRLKTAVEAALQGKKKVEDISHYEKGAYLYNTGKMEPNK